jgi:hypothetical protein
MRIVLNLYSLLLNLSYHGLENMDVLAYVRYT